MSEPILIVDDNPVNARLASLTLELAGFKVQTAADAQQALDAIAQTLPRLILMDVQLPGMDGLELTRRLKADPATAAIPVVAITSYAMRGDEERVRAAGCDGYIAKPIDTRTFAATVDGFLTAAEPAP